MRALVTGGGGREHCLAWKLAQSPQVERVWVAPGNAGTAMEPGLTNLAVDAMDFQALAKFAKDQAIDLTVVGPEAPLVAGMVDHFQQAGLRCFGPSKAAAQLEGSKTFAKRFMERHGIPTAAYAAFTDLQAAQAHLRQCSYPLVIKADGLAAGKGVVIAADEAEARQTLAAMLGGQALGDAGRQVVIEEFLQGEEASFIVIADGSAALPFASSQDHKAAYDGDQGPNTGGMGAYSPAPVVTPEAQARILREIIEPTLAGMRAEGMPYTGFLYAGLMIDPQGAPKVIEFNCRFGDPEAQPVLSRLASDLASLCLAACEGRLSDASMAFDSGSSRRTATASGDGRLGGASIAFDGGSSRRTDTASGDGRLGGASIAFDPRPALTVVLASGGYPGPYDTGLPITGLESLAELPGVKAFHAGTRLAADGSGQLLTAGGRVLGVTALAETLQEAQASAYQAAALVRFPQMRYRKDIAHRALPNK